MTGEKNRYSSVEKLWKLDDETLKTPKHDEMVIWLLNKTNIKKILSPFVFGDFGEDKNIKIESEVPIMAHNHFLVGYWDIVIHIRSIGIAFYIEVKPTIDSFGVTLRQLHTYQEYEPRSKGYIFLFTNDLKFKEAFESQGIKVIFAEETYEQGEE